MRTMREGLVRLSEDVHALSYRLHSSILEDLGLIEALKAECERFSNICSIRLDANFSGKLPHDVALCLLRIAQEGLRNTRRAVAEPGGGQPPARGRRTAARRQGRWRRLRSWAGSQHD